MYVITGGAGFIGSNIAAKLDKSDDEIVIVDLFGSSDIKWKNIAKRRIADIISPENLFSFLSDRKIKVDGVVHMGAVSATTETDIDLIVRSNFRLSIDLWEFCASAGIPYVYASSAATYGDGSAGFLDRSDESFLATLQPLNPYGWSKHAFDRWVRRRVDAGGCAPPRWAGLKFFNVYGPNEYHKGGQRSVAAQMFEQIRDFGRVRLFKSENPHYADGEQLRDFVWIGDCVDIAIWALKASNVPSDIYNAGSGTPRAFRDIAVTMFELAGRKPDIEYVDLPPNLRGKYQYFTCASLEKLRAAGYATPTHTLEQGLASYHSYLSGEDRFV
jgi:ADP-L-glycero-D-manno-heptose 6-epimerase